MKTHATDDRRRMLVRQLLALEQAQFWDVIASACRGRRELDIRVLQDCRRDAVACGRSDWVAEIDDHLRFARTDRRAAARWRRSLHDDFAAPEQ